MWIDIKFLPFLIVSHIMQLHLCNINMLLCIFLISQTKSCISAVTAQSIFHSCVNSKSCFMVSSEDGRRRRFLTKEVLARVSGER